MSPTTRPKQFTNFPALPKELRIKIWQYAAAQINWLIMFKNASWALDIPIFRYLHYPTPYLSLLSVNSEARDEALKQYIRIDTHSVPMHVYFNCHEHTLYLKGSHWDNDNIAYLVDHVALKQKGTVVRLRRRGIELWVAGVTPEGRALPLP